MRDNFFGAAGWDDLSFEEWEMSMDVFFEESARLLKKGGAMLAFMAIIKVETLIRIAERHKLYYKTTGIWHKLNPIDFFESLVVDLLLKMGYGGLEGSGEVTKKTGDGGTDGIIKQDELGLDMIYVQTKKWDNGSVISRPEIQKSAGALSGEGATKGVFITTTVFSKSAIDYAKSVPNTKSFALIYERNGKLCVNLECDPLEADFFTASIRGCNARLAHEQVTLEHRHDQWRCV